MKRYVKQTTQTIHYIADIRMENPNMSIPDDFDCSFLGFSFLEEVTPPIQEGYYAVELPPINNVQQWELIKETARIPSSISARQARLILLQENLLDDVENALSGNRAWQVEWEYASEIERTHPLIGAMQQALNLTNEQVDNLFINGVKL